MALIAEPRRMNPLLRLGVRVAERVTGRRMDPARLLAWYPRAAVSSGILETFVAHDEPSARLLKLVRITASVTATCAFCVDMNSAEHDGSGLTDAELTAVLASSPETVDTFSERELIAIEYARRISSTPLQFPASFTDRLTLAFSEREIVILATTAAQVNYWARTIQALGIPPAGFTDTCSVPER
ncbi:MAG: carboxymuconolactone decarboxylase family protein [Propioniciclava sp.]